MVACGWQQPSVWTADHIRVLADEILLRFKCIHLLLATSENFVLSPSNRETPVLSSLYNNALGGNHQDIILKYASNEMVAFIDKMLEDMLYRNGF